MNLRRFMYALSAAVLVAATASARASPPRRIVSLNLCTDQIVLDLVERDRIAAVSHLAADALVSPVAERAAGIASTRGEAESVLALEPDLVLAGTFTTPATLELLERIGRRVVRVPLASDLGGIHGAIRAVAAAVGEPARGEALVGALGTALAAARGDLAPFHEAVREAAPMSDAALPSALIYQVNGLSAGAGSLADALIRAAGFRNQAVGLGLGAGGTLPLETLAANPPDLVILSGPADEYRTVVAGNLRHPVLRAVLAERASVVIPWRLWLCGSHHVGEAVRQLAEARRALVAKGASQ